ncbi:MAG: 50S ribosomal protein L3 N(5)-glutamine methyltransferase [Gammaproteobacteria bacterium]|nr:50S ribosomal protein L3 N(5)-glutamine methyltransferase [Gammaproteobacteria bacterium]
MLKYNQLKTILDYIRFANTLFAETTLYYGHGTDNAWDEALALVLHTLHLPTDINPVILNANLTQQEQQKLENLIEKRVKDRIPVPYLTNQAWFAHLPFYVDERVLIPRSSLFELIEKHFTPWIDQDHVHQILDLCTGSGCIAIACAKYFPETEVDASDISKDALAVAKINILRHNVENQVKLYESDLFTALPQKKYDIIISNPPYVTNDEMANLPHEYNHEPTLGLVAGENGLDIVLQILQQAKSFLHKDGILIIEVGNAENALTEHFGHIPFTWIDFEKSEGGVLLLTAEQLNECSTILAAQD